MQYMYCAQFPMYGSKNSVVLPVAFMSREEAVAQFEQAVALLAMQQKMKKQFAELLEQQDAQGMII